MYSRGTHSPLTRLITMPESLASASPWTLPRIARASAVVLLIIGLALLIAPLASVLLLLFGAGLIAVILRAIADPLGRVLPVPQSLRVVIALLLLIALFGGAAWLFGAQISAQFSDLSGRMPQAIGGVEQWLRGLPFGEQLIESLRGMKLGGQDVFGRLAGFASLISSTLSNFLLVLFAGVYLALSPGLYRKGLVQLFPKGQSERVGHAADTAAHALRLWLVGQLVSMTVVGVLVGLGLWLVGVPSPLALGLIAGIAEFIPLVGPNLAAIPGLLVALTAGGNTALWALLVYIVVQQVESNLITPVVEKRAVSIPPALTLFGVLALGMLLGPLGVVLSAPLAVVLFVLVKQLYVRDTLGHDTEVPGEPKD